MYTCCIERNRNITLSDDEETFLPPEVGNITILYDVMQSYEMNYMAQVRVETYFQFRAVCLLYRRGLHC